MEDLLNTLLPLLTGGGSAAVIAVLIGVIGLLLYERIQTSKQIKSLTEQMLSLSATSSEAQMTMMREIIDKYNLGMMSTSQAITELKLVLAAIQGRLH